MKKSKGSQKSFGKRLFKNLDLTEEQQDLLAEIDQGKKDFYKNHKGGHREMIADILAEELNSDDARELSLKKSADRHELAHNQADVMMDFLETLSEEQKDQFIENAEQLQEKMREKMKKHEKNRDFEKKGFEGKE